MCILFCNWCTILDPHSDIGFNWIEYNSNKFIRKYSCFYTYVMHLLLGDSTSILINNDYPDI